MCLCRVTASHSCQGPVARRSRGPAAPLFTRGGSLCARRGGAQEPPASTGVPPRVRPNRVRADKAYASRKNRGYLRRRGIRCTIPDKADQARIARSSVPSVAGRPGSTPRTTRLGMPSSAASTASK